MKAGDLIRPKCKHTFESSGYALIAELCSDDVYGGGRAIITWVHNQAVHYMRWWELDELMEAVCK